MFKWFCTIFSLGAPVLVQSKVALITNEALIFHQTNKIKTMFTVNEIKII